MWAYDSDPAKLVNSNETKSKCKDQKKTENQMQSLSVKAERQLCGKYIYKTFTHKTISK